jgi:hypothetical protein
MVIGLNDSVLIARACEALGKMNALPSMPV